MTNDQSEEIAQLYSDGLTYAQIAVFYNMTPLVVAQHLRGLIKLRLLKKIRTEDVDDDTRDKAWFKICCARHLADLHRHHGDRARAVAA